METEALISSVPIPDPRLRNTRARIKLQGEIVDPANPPSGCYFHPRCRYAQDICKTDAPPFKQGPAGQPVLCHFADELRLASITEAEPVAR